MDILTKETVYQLVKEFVEDHYHHLGYYPIEIEIGGKVLDWYEYWEVLGDMPSYLVREI